MPDLSRAERVGECLLWTGPKTRGGYGYSGKQYVHRVSYETFVGPIPEGMEVDHLCRNTLCIEPSHLEPVTSVENHRRMRRPFCRKGHPMDGDNLYVGPDGRRRACLECRRRRTREHHWAHREERLEQMREAYLRKRSSR